MKAKAILVVIMLCVLITSIFGCHNNEVRKETAEKNYVRIYDVEFQEDESIVYEQHYARAGIMKYADGFSGETKIPFANQIEKIQEESGVEVEYIMLKSWLELRERIEETQEDNITTIILFNNSYDESILKEAGTGKYADMESALTDYGFYDEELYDQVVLNSGILENGQVLVPILFNVSGMIQGDPQAYEYEEWKKVAYNQSQNGKISYEEFLDYLVDSMYSYDQDEMILPYMSVGFLEEKVDLFLLASGMELDTYHNQEKLFSEAYEFYNHYMKTQVKGTDNTDTNQFLYAKYLVENEEMKTDAPLTEDIVTNLKLDDLVHNDPVEELSLFTMATALFDRTNYFVESSSSENVAYHSVFGTLAYRMYYVNRYVRRDGFQTTRVGNMNYWSIANMSGSGYAAQPICYAAVLEGGSTQLAAKVLKTMTDQYVDVKYGISINKQMQEIQLNEWKKESDLNASKIRTTHFLTDGTVVEAGDTSYWGILMTSPTPFFEDKEIYSEQVRDQLSNVVSAQIPDRELLDIWYETVTESVEAGMSVDKGYETLCERIDEWYN